MLDHRWLGKRPLPCSTQNSGSKVIPCAGLAKMTLIDRTLTEHYIVPPSVRRLALRLPGLDHEKGLFDLWSSIALH